MPHEASGSGRFRSNELLMCRLRELELFVLYQDQYFPQELLLYCRVVHELIIVNQSLPNPPCHDRQLDPGVSMPLQNATMRESSRVCLLKLISLSVSVQAQLVSGKAFFTTHWNGDNGELMQVNGNNKFMVWAENPTLAKPTSWQPLCSC